MTLMLRHASLTSRNLMYGELHVFIQRTLHMLWSTSTLSCYLQHDVLELFNPFLYVRKRDWSTLANPSHSNIVQIWLGICWDLLYTLRMELPSRQTLLANTNLWALAGVIDSALDLVCLCFVLWILSQLNNRNAANFCTFSASLVVPVWIADSNAVGINLPISQLSFVMDTRVTVTRYVLNSVQGIGYSC